MAYVISEDCLSIGLDDKSHLFLTEDGVKIYKNDKAFWCGYRFGKWIYLGEIKANKEQVKLLVSNNKVFSLDELAKNFISKSNPIICVGKWSALPEVNDYYNYYIFSDFSDEKNLNTLSVSVCHLDENNGIICDYLKTVKLDSKYKIDLDKEIMFRLDEIYAYFNIKH